MTIQTILAELRQERDRIENAITALESINGGTRTTAGRTSSGGKRIVSLAARRRMARAQRARWAKVKSAPKLTPAKRTMSASARRKIAAAQRARWAKIRAKKA
jgi:hypothetical protein